MKKKYFKLLPSLIISTVVYTNPCTAQKIDAAKVPSVVKETFSKNFPTATSVKWEQEDKNFEAGFTQNDKKISAVINAKGNLVETETDIAISELPASSKKNISLHYKEYKIKEAAIIKKADGEIIYEAEVNHKDVLFNAKGDFIKEAKD